MKFSARSICFVGMFTAIIAVLSILTIPTPIGVPFTLQTFAVALSGFVLGKKYGTVSTVLYVILGFIGVPVYAGMNAGPGVLFGTSGGYIFGFILMTFFCGLGMDVKGKKLGILFTLLFGMIGLACCHILGIIQLKLVTGLGWVAAAWAGSIPFLVKDILSVAGAYLIALAVRRALTAAHILDWDTESHKEQANA